MRCRSGTWLSFFVGYWLLTDQKMGLTLGDAKCTQVRDIGGFLSLTGMEQESNLA